MSLLTTFIAFPLTLLVIFIVVNPGNANASIGGNCDPTVGCASFSANLAQISCSNSFSGLFFAGPVCFTSGSLPLNSLITCPAQPLNPTATDCVLLNYCPIVQPSGTYCSVTLGNLLGSFTMLSKGSAISTNALGGVSGSTTGSSAFGLSFGLGIAGFIVVISIAIGLAVLSSINILGSGEGNFGSFALFTGGVLLALWTLLSGIEGFLGGASNSFFVQMNGALSGLGTLFYVFLTLVYTLGIVGSIARGTQ